MVCTTKEKEGLSQLPAGEVDVQTGENECFNCC